MSVSVSYVVPQAGGQLSCYFLTSFATSFGRRSARRFFLDILFNMILPVVPHKAVAEGCCESRMAERSH